MNNFTNVSTSILALVDIPFWEVVVKSTLAIALAVALTVLPFTRTGAGTGDAEPAPAGLAEPAQTAEPAQQVTLADHARTEPVTPVASPH